MGKLTALHRKMLATLAHRTPQIPHTNQDCIFRLEFFTGISACPARRARLPVLHTSPNCKKFHVAMRMF